MSDHGLFCAVLSADVCNACQRKKIMKEFYTKFTTIKEEDLNSSRRLDTPSPVQNIRDRLGSSSTSPVPMKGKKRHSRRNVKTPGNRQFDDILESSPPGFLPKIHVSQSVTGAKLDSSINASPIRQQLASVEESPERDRGNTSLRLPPIPMATQTKSNRDIKAQKKRDLKKTHLRTFVEREFEKVDEKISTCLPAICTKVNTKEVIRRELPPNKLEAYENLKNSISFPNLQHSIMNDMQDEQRNARMKRNKGQPQSDEEGDWNELLSWSS